MCEKIIWGRVKIRNHMLNFILCRNILGYGIKYSKIMPAYMAWILVLFSFFNINSSMGPILKFYHPLKGVGIIKIYRPTVLDDYTISFLVTIDSRIVTLKLYQNGDWNEVQKAGVSKEIVVFIHNKIEQFYQQMWVFRVKDVKSGFTKNRLVEKPLYEPIHFENNSFWNVIYPVK